jgi:TOBE domain
VVAVPLHQGALIRYSLTVAGQRLVAEVQNQVGRAQPEAGSRVTVHRYPERTEILPIE